MNWEALGALAELLGAVGVITTLLYLSFQVRQGLKDTRADALQRLSRDYASHSHVVMSDENVGPFIKGLTAYAALTPEERLKFDICAAGFVNIVENAIYHSEAGRLDEVLEMLKGYLGPRLFSYPGLKAWWLHGNKYGFAKTTTKTGSINRSRTTTVALASGILLRKHRQVPSCDWIAPEARCSDCRRSYGGRIRAAGQLSGDS